MSNARKIADLLDSNGDVNTANLDNVPASDNASSLSSGTIPAARIGSSSITNAKLAADAVDGTKIADNSIGLEHLVSGTDGNLITYDASGDPAYVTTGTSGQVLTSGGAGVAPTFQTAAGATGMDDVSGVARATSGLLFNADTADANKLDDYEEGTWTPTTNGDATGVFSGSVYGKYVKVGTLVYATFNFTVSTSFTGNSIGGLPYAVGSLSGSSVRPSMPIWFNAGSADYMIMTTIGGGGSYVGFSKFSGYQAWSPLINNNIRGTVIYQSA